MVGWLREQHGQSMVEFAMLLPAFMFIVAGIFDFSRAIFYYNSLAEAARVGARYAIVRGENAASTDQTGPCTGSATCTCDDTDGTGGNPPNGSAIRTVVLSRTTGMNSADVTVTCSWPDVNTSGSYLNQRNKRVKVKVEYTYQPVLLSFIPAGNITLQGETTSFIQY